MNEECDGCYLMRIFSIEHKKENISCGHENLKCPCKTCIVKVMCDIIENSQTCESFINFNLIYNDDTYWDRKRNEYGMPKM